MGNMLLGANIDVNLNPKNRRQWSSTIYMAAIKQPKIAWKMLERKELIVEKEHYNWPSDAALLASDDKLSTALRSREDHSQEEPNGGN